MGDRRAARLGQALRRRVPRTGRAAGLSPRDPGCEDAPPDLRAGIRDRGHRPLRTLGTLAGLALAYAHFARTFRGPRERFWHRMTTAGFTLGALALAGGEAERVRPRWRDLPLGLAIAAGLFAIFQVGDRQARRVMPRGGEQIGEIYALREIRPKEEIAIRLATVIGPAEELFWRGWLQRRVGWLPAAIAYAGAHIATGNATLIGAAATAGLYWSALAALGAPMTALIVSHSAWDVWIFLVRPTQRQSETPEEGSGVSTH